MHFQREAAGTKTQKRTAPNKVGCLQKEATTEEKKKKTFAKLPVRRN